MEVEHISYIFGSFARRRQSQDVSTTQRSQSAKISHDRSKSAPHTSKKSEPLLPRAKSVCNYALDEIKFKCPLCRNLFVEPRVLPCLHTFCTPCLRKLTINENESKMQAPHRTMDVSCEGGLPTFAVRSNTDDDRSTARTVTCPNCTSTFELPIDGIQGFPPNYLLQHRMVLATLNSRATKLLCDLCTNDITATFRCTECAVSLCQECADNHGRQRNYVHHEVLRLEEARRRGITNVRKQIMCALHSDNELSVFCSSCCQITCRDCFIENHRNHTSEPISRAARHYMSNIKQALSKTRLIADKTSNATAKLQEASKRIETHCDNVQNEIDKFIREYIEAIEQHRKKLHREVNETRVEKLHCIDQHAIDLQKRLTDIKDLLLFADELINDGTDTEILSFIKLIFQRLEICNHKSIPELKISESLQFLPKEVASKFWNSCPLYGVVTTQTVVPGRCTLLQEGLQNLRVGKRADIILQLRDRTDALLQRGGETVSAEIKHRETGSSKSIILQIEDKKNGTYRIYFTPDVPGKYALFVNVKSQPIKDSPFAFAVRPFHPHHGAFHCCSFCSSGGSKDATCGCGGKMPGGYKGCGHGHEGHPGRRHWSCCGNILEHSECNRRNSTHYQFTL